MSQSPYKGFNRKVTERTKSLIETRLNPPIRGSIENKKTFLKEES